MVAAFACAVLAPAGAFGQRIIGKITGYMYLENPVWAEAKDPENKGYSFRDLVPTVPAKYRKLYPHIPKEVCIAALTAEEQKPGDMIGIRVGGGRTTPSTIVVAPGTKLQFQNTDPFSHKLYAKGQGSFSPNETTKGSTREWTVPSAGVFEVRDELAPSLRMWIVAEPKVAAITYPSKKGEYRLSVPEGAYSVQAYFAGQPVGAPMPANVGRRDAKLKSIVVAKQKKEEKK